MSRHRLMRDPCPSRKPTQRLRSSDLSQRLHTTFNSPGRKVRPPLPHRTPSPSRDAPPLHPPPTPRPPTLPALHTAALHPSRAAAP